MIIQGKMEKTWTRTPIRMLDTTQHNRGMPKDREVWARQGYDISKAVADMAYWEHPDITKHFEDSYNLHDLRSLVIIEKTGTVTPRYRGNMTKYIKETDMPTNSTVWRGLVFLEDWCPGHYFEIDKKIQQWSAGSYLLWSDDTEYTTANLGTMTKYTLQLTGWKQ